MVVHKTISQLLKLCTTAMYIIASRSYRMIIKMVALSSTAAGVCQQVPKTIKIKYSIYKKEAVLKQRKTSETNPFSLQKNVERYTN